MNGKNLEYTTNLNTLFSSGVKALSNANFHMNQEFIWPAIKSDLIYFSESILPDSLKCILSFAKHMGILGTSVDIVN